MSWNALQDLNQITGIHDWESQRANPRPYAIVILPADLDPWLVVGDIARAMDPHVPSGCGESSTCGAMEVSFRTCAVYAFAAPPTPRHTEAP